METFTEDERKYLLELKNTRPELYETERQRIINIRQSFSDLLDSKAGKTVLWWILSECNIFGSSMTGNAWANFKEGKRAVGLDLLNQIIAANPQGWLNLQQENMSDLTNTLETLND